MVASTDYEWTPRLTDLGTYLQAALPVDRFPAAEQGGIYRSSARAVRRVGLALEPSPQLADWVRTNDLDALWLHRPWRLRLEDLPPDVGVLYHHLPFDEHLTMGLNPLLARRMGLRDVEELGYRPPVADQGVPLPPRPIGMLGTAPPRPFDDWALWVSGQFGGYERSEPGLDPTPARVAVVGAMTAALVQEAYVRGAGLYLTGQYRTGAQKAVAETGMGVIAIGHRRSEAWGVRALQLLLREKWPALTLLIDPASERFAE